MNAPNDVGEADDEDVPNAVGDADPIDDAERWNRAGRAAVAEALEVARGDLDATAWDLVEALYQGEDPDPDDVQRARRDLNAVHRALEELVAPAAGLESWERLPDIPMGVLWEETGHPKAEGVDPREYVDDVEAEETGDNDE